MGKVLEKKRVVFWGTGNTAKGYINQIKKLSNKFEIVAFTDSRQEKLEDPFLWEGYKLVAPKRVCGLGIDYICILSIWEWEIRKKIYDENLFKLSKILSFYEICMMNSFNMELTESYEKLLQSVHPRQRDAANMWRVYESLKRDYAHILCDSSYWKLNLKEKVHFKSNVKPIWILWLQGFERAPELVRVCVRSLQRALGNKEHICLLEESNLSTYIDMPDHIIQKWKEGNISNTHFSDLVRLRLLNVYGGVWIDATVYFTGNKLPGYIKDTELFMYNMRESWKACTEPKIAANWLISARPANKLLIILETLLNEYWKEKEKIVNYYMFHIFWTIVVECFPEEWNQVEAIIRDPAQLLNIELEHTFSEERFERIKRMSDVHKLSYKGGYMGADKDSFWAKLCEIEGEG